MKLIDIAGQRFGRLIVIEKAAVPRMWRCRCDCGAELLATGPNLRSGRTRSCGCLAAEWSRHLGANPSFISKRADSQARHGHKRRRATSLEYKTWLAMKRRCSDTKSKSYAGWGGRGIQVCDRWRSSFEAFLADMGPRPSPSHSIDRIDPEDHYRPDNCRWATPTEQGSEHRRDLIELTVLGVTYPSAKAACRALGIPYGRTMMRLAAGCTVEEALFATRAELAKKRPRESYIAKSRRAAVASQAEA